MFERVLQDGIAQQACCFRPLHGIMIEKPVNDLCLCRMAGKRPINRKIYVWRSESSKDVRSFHSRFHCVTHLEEDDLMLTRVSLTT